MSQLHEFDFDLMKKLAAESPEEFARRRETLIQEAIESFKAPEQGRQLQAAIDANRVCIPQGEAVYSALGDQVADMVSSLALVIRRIRMCDENRTQMLDARCKP